MPAPPQRVVQHLAGDPFDRVFAGRVDVGEKQLVGAVEGIEEVAEQVARARVAVRLKEHDDAAPEALARRRQRRPDLGRMVPVVAHHHDAADLAADLEAPVDAAELRQRVAHGLEAHVELGRHRQRGERVERLMAARQPHGAARRAAVPPRSTSKVVSMPQTVRLRATKSASGAVP